MALTQKKALRQAWESYMHDRVRLYRQSTRTRLPQHESYTLRDSGAVFFRGSNQMFEGIGIDYGTFKTKYRLTGYVPTMFRLEDLLAAYGE